MILTDSLLLPASTVCFLYAGGKAKDIMQYGFTFNNIHSSEMGLTVRTKNKPIIPAPKRATSSLSTRDGLLDYSQSNPYGHILFEQREISVECSFIKKSLEEIRRTARDIAVWLGFSVGKLVFDDEPDVYYIARVSNRLDLEQQLFRGSFRIVFSCEPYAHSFFKSGVVHSYGEGLSYNGTVHYGGLNSFYLTGAKIVTVENKGVYVRPKIKIDGSFDKISIICNKKILTCTEPQKSGILVIDCEKMTAVKNSVINVLPAVSGDFIELKNGKNSVTFTGNNLDCVVTFEFEFLYI